MQFAKVDFLTSATHWVRRLVPFLVRLARKPVISKENPPCPPDCECSLRWILFSKTYFFIAKKKNQSNRNLNGPSDSLRMILSRRLGTSSDAEVIAAEATHWQLLFCCRLNQCPATIPAEPSILTRTQRETAPKRKLAIGASFHECYESRSADERT